MLFDLSMTELLLIGVVALVVIGPKDLPKALRVAGYWVGKARTLSREFQSSVEQMIREAELDEMRQELKKATEIDIEQEFRQTIDPTGSLAESLKPPELPKLFETEAPTTHPVIQAPQADASTTAPTVGAVQNGGADPLVAESPPQDSNTAPAHAKAQCNPRDAVAPEFPPSRE